MNDKTQIMPMLLDHAAQAASAGEVPVAAAVVHSATGEVLAVAVNRVERESDPTAHAEILALRDAAQKLGSPRLIDCDLYVTLEPCAMCAAAISMARIRKLVFGAYDPKGGGVEHGPRFYSQPTCHHAPEVVGGVRESECSAQLKAFFEGLRP